MELYNQEEKLHYVFKFLKLSTNEIAKKLEISSGLVSQIQNYSNGKLRKYHLYAICYAYNIPIEIFENKNINTKEMIRNLLEPIKNKDEVFEKDYEILQKIIGTWYLYSYSSNKNSLEIWETETTVYEDFSVQDIHNNRGKLYIGKNQSIIIKESNNSKNLTSITFDNNRITYEKFAFSRVSKSNGLNKELFNFGFFSKNKVDLDEAQEVLGKIEKAQLQMDYEMLERINFFI